MENYVITIDVQHDRSTIAVWAREPEGWLHPVWRDWRRYTAPPPVVTQVVCAALVALAGRSDGDAVAQDLCELTGDLW